MRTTSNPARSIGATDGTTRQGSGGPTDLTDLTDMGTLKRLLARHGIAPE